MAAETFKLALVLKAFDGVTGPLRKINSALDQVQKPLRNFEKAIGNFGESSGINRLGESLSNVKEAASKVGSAVFSLVSKFALVGGAAVGIFGKIVNDTVESTSKLVDLRNATGASVESIQRLGFAFEQSGGNTEDFQSGLVKFSKNLGDAKRQAGPLFQILSKYDRPLLQKMLSTKDTGEALTLFVKKIAQAKSDTVRLSLATAAVGKKSNVALASLAKDGPDNVDTLMAKTPGVISNEQASRIESFGDLLGELGKRIGAIPRPIVAELIPVLDQLGNTFNSFLIGKEQAIRDWAKDFGAKLPGRIKVLKNAFLGLWEKMKPIRDAVSWIASDSTRLQAALGILAAVIAGPVIIAMGGLIASMVELGIAMLTTPIGWICDGLLLLVGIGYLVYTRWDQIKEFFITLWDSPAGKLFRFFTPVGMLIDAAVNVIKNWKQVKTFFLSIWEGPIGEMIRIFVPILMLIRFGEIVVTQWEKVKRILSDVVSVMAQMSGLSTMKRLLGFGENGTKITGFDQFFEQEAEANKNLFGTVKDLGETMGSLSEAMDNPKSMADFSSTSNPDSAQKFLSSYNIAPQTPPPLQVITKEASVRVTFENLPQGTRVEKDDKSEAPLNLNLGYAMEGS